mgnify:FL=1|tara:strand:- start:214 stop:705 length:492 start_codon:yes stop_codon:yes gene_type:complete
MGEIVEIDTIQKSFDFFSEAKRNNDSIQKSQHLTGEIDLNYIESMITSQVIAAIRSPFSPSKIKMWAAKKDGKYVGTIIFQDSSGNNQNQSRMLYETVWIMWGKDTGKLSLKLLKTAERYAKDNSIPFISMSRMTSTESGKRLGKIYERMGYHQDTATHIKKL